MKFNVVRIGQSMPVGRTNAAFLIEDQWDDWGKYRTQFYLRIADLSGILHDIGNVKIGHQGLLPGATTAENTRAPVLQDQFAILPPSYFSLARGETYYEALLKLPDDLGLTVLRGLRDIAYDLKIFDKVNNEYVVGESLLRDLPSANVRNRWHRLARGDATLTPFQFCYLRPAPQLGLPPPPPMDFVVTPNSTPPTNVHALIGRNGVGKTHFMQHLAKALLNSGGPDKSAGTLSPLGHNSDDWTFSGLIVVSFSAFDDFDLPILETSEITAHAVGLRIKNAETQVVRVKSPSDLAHDFTNSFAICRKGLRADRWRQAVVTLANDPVFADANVSDLLSLPDELWQAEAFDFFHRRLSSGHKIVLLTITRLVELVDERTLVLMDEPEGHLHPPLLSAFIRSLSDLLVRRNGVAILATHSPVVLQEVPQSCAWILQRAGHSSVAERPTIETFGENLGVLTREVFGFEVTTAGFYGLIQTAVYSTPPLNYERVLKHFDEKLGAEGRAIARALVTNRDIKRTQ
ncbi:AAA family ATPase [Janthinobacterium sp. 75]|uniref:AAA family ATPase n=1 Tax=Janthinobacterium sp. 75 TaxID=2135628 RepID=UPI0010637512|nr:AAA family ATPase [Janthinobacterium sp. 75]TDY35347.1 putative AbiEii toxin of type IV toxin-antitoxin system [Janthinobacterium sp. 75]